MNTCRIRISAKIFVLLLAVPASGLSGCKGSATPGLKTPDLALSNTALLPGPGEPYPLYAGRAPPGTPVMPHATY